MCGICGQLNIANHPVGRELLRNMTMTLRHRGPDDTGLYCDGGLGLGHTRLSIIDVSGGGQPMCMPDGSLAITFNGEIFNYLELRDELICKGHRFLTASDTEVLLHLYQEEGERCVERLNGQWAFAIWDRRRRELFLSRDRFGVRPLFYTRTHTSFLFASEIKALLACQEVGCDLDLEGLDQIFTFWFPLPPRTAFRDIWQVPPGCSLLVDGDGRLRGSRHWELQYAPEGEYIAGSTERLAEELLALLADATRLRLRSDVPVGAYVSGGLDSTLITALARKYASSGLRSFSVAFTDPRYDESSYQEAASAFLQTEHSTLHCSEADVARSFPDVVWHTEQPILRTAPAPLFLLSDMVRNSGYKVVLSGEGADEILGGYDIYKETKIRSFWARASGSLSRPRLLQRLYPYMGDIGKQPRAYLERFFCVTEKDLANPFFSHLPRWNVTASLKRFLSSDVRQSLHPEAAMSELSRALPNSFPSWSPFQRAEYLESAYLLPGYILSSQGDRMAMAHSVEGRYPFLDHRVAEFAARLHPNVKMKVLDQKHLLKRAALGWIPESVRLRYKQPYRAPGAFDLTGPSAEYIEEMLSARRIQQEGIFDAAAVDSLVRKFRRGLATGSRDQMALAGILSTQILLDRSRRERVAGQEAVPRPAAMSVDYTGVACTPRN